MTGVFFLSLLVGFSGALIPGPMLAVTLNQSLLVGWSAGLWIALGHVLSELGLLVAIRAGLGGVLTRPAVTRAISLVGSLVLLYLAWTMAGTALHPLQVEEQVAGSTMTAGLLMGQGVVLSVTNATWYVWWATVGIGLIAAQIGKHGDRAWPAFFIGHSLADLIWYGGVSALIAVGGRFLNENLHRGLILTCALLIAVIGILFFIRPLRDWRRERRGTAVAAEMNERV